MSNSPDEPLSSNVPSQHRAVLQHVYDQFRVVGEWPSAWLVNVDLQDRLNEEGGIRSICSEIGKALVVCGHDEASPVRLTLRGVEACKDSDDDIENFLAFIRFCAAAMRRSRSNVATVTQEEFATHRRLTDLEATRAVKLALAEGTFFQGTSGTSVTLRPLVATMHSVNSVAEYEQETNKAVVRAYGPRVSFADVPRQIRRVFLSHAARDRRLAEYLADVIRLSVGQIGVFVASTPGSIETGEEWLGRIKAELKQADAYLVLLTPNSVERRWLWFETGAAWMSDRRLIPVVACGLEKSQVPAPLGAHQVLSLSDESDVRQLFRDLQLALSDVAKFVKAVGEIASEDLRE